MKITNYYEGPTDPVGLKLTLTATEKTPSGEIGIGEPRPALPFIVSPEIMEADNARQFLSEHAVCLGMSREWEGCVVWELKK